MSKPRLITVQEFAECENVTDRAIRKRILIGKLTPAKIIESNMGQGGKSYLLDYSLLTPDGKMRYMERNARNLKQKFQGLVPEKKQMQEDEFKDLIFYTQRMEHKYGERYIMDMNYKIKVAETAIAIQKGSGSSKEKTRKLEEYAAELGTSVATIYRYIKAYNEKGPLGMGRKDPETKGVRKRVPLEMRDFIELMVIQNKLPQDIYDEVCRASALRGWKVPSLQTIYRVIKEDVPEEVKTYYQMGIEDWRNKFEPTALRDSQSLKVNEGWMLDHQTLDLFIEFNGHAVRPTLTAFIDVRSRVYPGWWIDINGSSETIVKALSYAVTPKPEKELPFGGTPEWIYLDRGKDMRSKRLNGPKQKDIQKNESLLLSPYVKGTFKYLNIEPVTALPYNPTSKAQIERSFGEVARKFSRSQRSWCGSKPEERPENFDEKAMLKKGLLPTLDEIREEFKKWIIDVYHKKKHPQEAATKLQVYMTAEKAATGIPGLDSIRLAGMKWDTAKIYKWGISKWNRVFWSDEFNNIGVMGQTAIIRWEPDNIGKLYIFIGNSKKPIVAENKELLAFRASEEAVAMLMKQKKTKRKNVKLREEFLSQEFEDICNIVNEKKESQAQLIDKKAKTKLRMLTGLEGTKLPKQEKSLSDVLLERLAGEVLDGVKAN